MDLSQLLAAAAAGGLSDAELAEFNKLLPGYDKLLGIRYTKVTLDEIRAELRVSNDHMQPTGLVNGGVYCSLAESVGSFAGIVAAGTPHVVGVNNSTDFLSSVRGGVIVATAHPLHVGNRTQLWEVIMTHRDKVVARSRLRTMVLRK